MIEIHACKMGFVLVYSPKCVFLVEIIKSGFKIAFCYTTQFLVSFFCKLQKASFQKERQGPYEFEVHFCP